VSRDWVFDLVTYDGVDVGGLDEARTRRSASGRAALIVETARDAGDRGRAADLVRAATPLARRAVRRLVRETGWGGPWKGAVEVLADPTLAVAGGTLRRGHRPGEPNSFDLMVRLPLSWLELVLGAGPAVLADRYLVMDRTPEDTRPIFGGGPSVVELLVFAPDKTVQAGDESRSVYRFGMAPALVEMVDDPDEIGWI
jgi:hypothetical protein